MSIQHNLFIFVPQSDWDNNAYELSRLHFSGLLNTIQQHLWLSQYLHSCYDIAKIGEYVYE